MLLDGVCMGLAQHSSLNHQGTYLLGSVAGLVDCLLPPAVLVIFENSADFADIAEYFWNFDAKSSISFCCYVCDIGSTLGATIMSLASLLAATASTNIIGMVIKLFIQFIEYYHRISSANKTMSIVTMNNIQKSFANTFQKDSWGSLLQTAFEITENEQLFSNI